jgi:hypothetical protein
MVRLAIDDSSVDMPRLYEWIRGQAWIHGSSYLRAQYQLELKRPAISRRAMSRLKKVGQEIDAGDRMRSFSRQPRGKPH